MPLVRPAPLSLLPGPAQAEFQRTSDVDENFLGQRSLTSIIWSCFATIFACTWVVVHPNIPDELDSEWTIIGRRLKVMVYTLLVPELVLYWASKQWYAARETSRKHAARGWTMSHGFFIGMGGFVLCMEGRLCRPLDITDLTDLVELEELDSWPTIPEKDILDKSKGDYFTKSVVVIQTTWFILQCIARGILGPALTELELVTLAFAALSGAMYFFWWHKPLDIRRPILLHATPLATMKFAHGNSHEHALDIHSTSISGLNSASTPSIKQPYRSPLPHGHHEGRPFRRTRSLSSLTPPCASSHDFSEKSGVSPSGSALSSMPAGPTLRNTHLDPYDLNDVYFSKWRFNMNPVVNILAHTNDGVSSRYKKIQQTVLNTFAWPVRSFIQDIQELRHSGEILSGNGECRVSTFYAAMRLQLQHELTILFLIAATLFGCIHCAAWFFAFPSAAERWIWRSSALAVSILPTLFALQWLLVYKFTTGQYNPSTSRLIDRFERVFHATSIARILIMFALYILARIALLVLPLLSLRALPPQAFIDINWADAIPHF